jgi:hypothetical protein
LACPAGNPAAAATPAAVAMAVWVKNARRSGSGTASQVKWLGGLFMAFPLEDFHRNP